MKPTSLNLPHIAVISSGRPGNVERMQKHLGRLSGLERWYVGPDEEADYRYGGATNVVAGEGYIQNRNLALEEAFAQGKVCIQLDDDLVRVQWCPDGVTKHDISLERAIGLVSAALGRGAYLAGSAATDNAFFMPKQDGRIVPISEHAFVMAALMAAAPNPLRFDERLRLKADIGYSVEHLLKYGKVARVNTVMAKFLFQTNAGGAVMYRTHALQQEMIALLHEKYPGALQRGRNEDELRLVWPPREPVAYVSPKKEDTL